jgi:signal transduction histidine kinase
VLAIALFALPMGAVVGKYVVDDERGELEQLANAAAVSASADIARGQRPGALPPTAADTKVAIYDTHGLRIAGNGPSTGDSHVKTALRDNRSSGVINTDIVIAVPITNDVSVLGAVWADTPRSEAYDRIGVIWLLMAGLALAALATAWLVARTLAARLSRPLEHLATTASTLGDGDFSVRYRRAGVTEIDAVGAALDATAVRLGDLLTRERAFSTDASHQLRTPLTGLRLGLEIALEDPRQDLRDAITTAIAGTERLQHTIEDLLHLARDSDRGATPLDLPLLLTELESTWSEQLAAAGRALVITIQRGTPAARASTAAVRQILTVLLDNAFNHGAGTVSLSARDAGKTVAIDVADEGPGITTPTAQLFARRPPNATGHGIGLALARRLAEAEGGRLHLSRPCPPTFTLLAPASQDHPDRG